MKPWAFKVRGGGNATGTKGGSIKAGIQGGVGALWYEDKVFTVATHQDQWIATPPQLTSNPYQYHNKPMSNPTVPMRYLSVCSGMEAASVAWHPLGWTPVGFSEIEPFPCAILKHHFPNTPNYGSLTEHASWPLEPGAIDLLVGGTPCQSFSVAGLRKGLADPRGNLALTFLALADRLKPRWIIWENVPGVLSSGGGRDFGSFLGALVELGYGFAYRILDAQHFRGTPQRRRRVFVVAYRDPVTGLGDWAAAAEVLSLGEGLRGYLEAGGKKRKAVAPDAGSGVEAGLPATVGTLCADSHPGAYSGQDAYTGRLIPDVLQPYTASSFAQYAEGVGTVRASGGDLGGGSETLLAQPTPYRKSKRASSTTDNETWVPADASNTPLNNFDLGDTRTTHAVVSCSDIAPTVTSSGPPYSRTGNERVEAQALVAHAIAFQPGNLMRKAGANPSTETFPTLTKARTDQSPHVAMPMAVRRLTPTECERLQGFPDNWSQIPWKGKPADQCPDGPRYKACGNSMAVPVMRWIGEQIARYELSQNHETK